MELDQSNSTEAKGEFLSTAANPQQQEQQQPTPCLQHSRKKKSKNKNKKASSSVGAQGKEGAAVLADLQLAKAEDESLMINGRTLSNQLNLQLHIGNQINGLPEVVNQLLPGVHERGPAVDVNESYSSLTIECVPTYEVVNGHGDNETLKNSTDTDTISQSSNVATKKTKRKPNNKKNLPLNKPPSCRELNESATPVDTGPQQQESELIEEQQQQQLQQQPNEQQPSQPMTVGSNGLPLQDPNSDNIENSYEANNNTAPQNSSTIKSANEPTESEDAQTDRTKSRTEASSSMGVEGTNLLMAESQFQPPLDLTNVHIEYKEYESELQMHDIMRLIQAELSEPYSIYTYRYFIYNWPKLCFLASHGNQYVGAIVCKLDMYLHIRRGYIAMLAVRKEYRKLKIGTTLVQKAIEAMLADDADEVVLETEMSNVPALRLYENLGFVRDKRLFRYYLNGVDALRLKLWFR